MKNSGNVTIFWKILNLWIRMLACFSGILGVFGKMQKNSAFDLTGSWRKTDTFCELDIHIVVMPMTKGLSHEQKIIPPEDAPERIRCASCACGLLSGVCSGRSSEFAGWKYRKHAASGSVWCGRK